MKLTFTAAEKNPTVQDGDVIFFIDKSLNPAYSRKKGNTEQKWIHFVNSATKIVRLQGKTLCTREGAERPFYVEGTMYWTKKEAERALRALNEKLAEIKNKKAKILAVAE